MLKFQNGRGFYIGAYNAPGALQANGTEEHPIHFTSINQTPAVGNWIGLYFYNLADDGSSMEHCTIEYAGDAVFINNARPSLRNCSIKNNRKAVYLSGAGCFQADISCNTFENNGYGVYIGSQAQPIMEQNNFKGNSSYGVYNVSGLAIVAEDNWWNDPLGPNQSGDKILGNVDSDPWSTTEIECSSGEPNQAPDVPTGPTPADQAIQVDIVSGIDLLWTGGDPNPLDTIAYDLYQGTSTENLTLLAPNLSITRYHLSELSRGITYYWKIVAKDNHGLETEGPIWRFTAEGDPPDLIVSNLATTPAGNLQTGQNVTLTAQVDNIGTGPAVDSFTVSFNIGGAGIGTPIVNTVIPAGASTQVSQSWTYGGGDPTIEVNVDDQNQISETNESNNVLAALLSDVADNAPPAIVQTIPVNGVFASQANQIQITLSDAMGTVDDASVMASFALTDSNQQSVTGAISENNDTFTFVPTTIPMADDAYQATVTATDTYGNSQTYAFSFTVDATPPGKPVITGGTVASGTIQPRPESNTADQFLTELTGTRDPGTSLWINGALKVDFSDADWTVELVLQPGENAIEVWLKDRAGNQGPSEWVDVEVTTTDAIIYEYDASGRVMQIHQNQ